MKYEDLDDMLIFIILLNLLGNFLTLFAALFQQRCDKKKDHEQEESKEKFKRELADLHTRIASLEKELGSAAKIKYNPSH
ncbi:hypothetical protein [Sporomusa acidovorans]|uniref:Uncharacterized protein n=1 Tax=Sporomusa acidovorans (strain ATCC 49682 / DSM 3132 / Mol) TaxID=1123286 RepID=A0ABZ3JB45_SPOA4|nr:hypothetical protein [Sporomusa acidovorans]OZC21808.1 hypothetical protein SPACI_18830 [Sporomusa acidovorans DSM 3132]SDD56242.1 hypothetical protein SAMN04488499_100250 [Sporomusa acidovorans]